MKMDTKDMGNFTDGVHAGAELAASWHETMSAAAIRDGNETARDLHRSFAFAIRMLFGSQRPTKWELKRLYDLAEAAGAKNAAALLWAAGNTIPQDRPQTGSDA